MKVLNLFAGIGGNRTLWNQIPDIEVTAVEYDERVASVYNKLYPADNVIVADAYDYLLQHMEEYDAIWASPPCQSHSVMNRTLHEENCKRFPDFRLYSIIAYMRQFYKGKFIVENVKPYYEPLIEPSAILGRHLFWTNFKVVERDFKFFFAGIIKKWTKPDIDALCKDRKIERSVFAGIPEREMLVMLSNCVNPDVGLYLLKTAIHGFKINDLGEY